MNLFPSLRRHRGSWLAGDLLIDVQPLQLFYRLGTGPLRQLCGVAARPDFIAAVAALMGVLVFETPGLFIVIGVSLLLLVHRASRPNIAVLGRITGTNDQYTDVERYPENLITDRAAILGVEGGLFFASSGTIRDRVRAEPAKPGVRAIVIDGETSPFIDLMAVRTVEELTGELRRVGVDLLLAHEIERVGELIARAEGEQPEVEVYPTVAAAIAAIVRPATAAV